MPQSAITTSRSILMHTSLAYLSPELQTLDSILRDSFSGRLIVVPPRLRLPTEILLIIRQHLFPAITTSLYERSTQALARYESCIRRLLCPDCLSYNQEVYGPEIWGWEHFTGACCCRRKGSGQAEPPQLPEYGDFWNHNQINPAGHSWLELYLSFESKRLANCQRSFHSIWDLVGTVLSDHGCRLSDVPTASGHPTPRRHGHALPLRGMRISIDIPTSVSIVPAESLLEANDSLISAPTILHRADRDLGLSIAYEKGLQLWKEGPPPRRRFYSKGSLDPSTLRSQAMTFCTAITTVAVAALSLPLTFATLALTVLCFYSQSRALRIL
ncbi:hypothetical protein DXG03_001521 [Asterophora parasitica]|uniref:Uncharacterized protein n=1 Tax=Asterophora parasitica TaxID=117018 RepID=A0A9P7G4V8_9AGAR|nr:hypothetical protein DXG03_001521 [Asterophora parasitica]